MAVSVASTGGGCRMQLAHQSELPLALPSGSAYKRGGKTSAQLAQRLEGDEKRATQAAHTSAAGQLRHTAHWLTSAGSEK